MKNIIIEVEKEIKNCKEKINIGQGPLMTCGEKYGYVVILCDKCKGKKSILDKL